MRKGRLISGLIGIALLVGCASSGGIKPIAPNVGEKLIRSTHPNRPTWTYREPEKEGENLVFVGLSGKYATETEGREDAQRRAMTNVVRYMGTFVKDNFQRLTVSHGLSTSIMDPTVATRRFEEQLNSALASHVKVKEYYIEQWQNKLQETYFLVYALVNVPQKAVDQVYQNTLDNQIEDLKKKRDEATDEKAKQQIEDTMKAFEEAKKQGFGPKE